jgi:hypothetical protein
VTAGGRPPSPEERPHNITDKARIRDLERQVEDLTAERDDLEQRFDDLRREKMDRWSDGFAAGYAASHRDWRQQ